MNERPGKDRRGGDKADEDKEFRIFRGNKGDEKTCKDIEEGDERMTETDAQICLKCKRERSLMVTRKSQAGLSGGYIMTYWRYSKGNHDCRHDWKTKASLKPAEMQI